MVVKGAHNVSIKAGAESLRSTAMLVTAYGQMFPPTVIFISMAPRVAGIPFTHVQDFLFFFSGLSTLTYFVFGSLLYISATALDQRL